MPDADLQLRLYVAGNAPNSLRAINNLNQLCATHVKHSYQIEVVDVLTQTSRALADGVLVTPTLIRVAPNPVVHIIGDLSQSAQVLSILVPV